MKTLKKILVVVGTRPNFIKVTQFKKVASTYENIDLRIVHTGQHFDAKMADVFFEQFELKPDFFLNINANISPNHQIAEIMIKLEKLVLNEFSADLIIVVGDVNSTMAAAITANKLGIKLAHLESGLRSYDKTMPEEHNRIITDAISNYFLITEPSGWDNLIKEGVSEEKMFFVGNTMIDTMVAFSNEIEKNSILEKLNINPHQYILMTMHRPASVDHMEGLSKLLKLIEYISARNSIVFPIHPRTLKSIEKFGLKSSFENIKNLIYTEPLDYFSFQKLIKHSHYILTDSGGIQEESTFMQIPCLTLRPNTERPITCTIGTNTLVPFEINTIVNYIDQIEQKKYKKGQIPDMWDGKSTERIFDKLVQVI